MKQWLLGKVAGCLALLMSASMLVPLLASAQIWYNDDFTYNNGKISGSVISDTYSPNPISFNLANDQGTSIGVAQAVYDPTVTGDTYYHYVIRNQSVTSDTYDYVRLTSVADSAYDIDSVTKTVYHATRGCSYCGGGGGGWGYIPPSGDDGVTVDAQGNVDADSLSQALKKSDQVTVSISGNTAHIPASALVDAPEDAVLVISNDYGTYQLPLDVLDLTALADQLGTTVAQMTIDVTIAQASAATAAKVRNAADEAGVTLVGNPLSFELQATGNGKTVDIRSFGHTYVSRTMSLNDTVDPSHAAGVVFDPDTGGLYFVPSKFADKDGKTIASLMRNGNSVYAVIRADKSFDDLGSVPWAKDDIELLANKLIVYGETEKQFKPDWYVSRAEFAALLVRSLGLEAMDASGAGTYRDVDPSAWYARDVAIATSAGLVFGDKGANTFRPNAPISREELAAMVVRAMKITGYPGDAPEVLANALAPFTDIASISGWARSEIAQAIAAGIVYGESDTVIAPKATATRAEAAAMVKRFLSKVGFIDQ